MRAPLIPDCVMLLHERQPATTSAHHDTNLSLFFKRKIIGSNSCILKRFTRGGQRQRHGARHVLAIFGIELSFPIKVENLGGDLHRRIGNVEAFDPAHPALALAQRLPIGLAADTDRGYATYASDDYAARLFEAAQHD